MRRDAPGAALLHPLTLTSVALLLLNDHVLKRLAPGVLSGKMSDFAGIILLPIFLQAAYELTAARLSGRAPSRKASNRALAVAVAASCVGFGLVELWGVADTAYRLGLGALQWPFHALPSLFTEGRLPGVRPVQATMDPSDLLALTMAPVAWLVGRRRAASERSPVAALAALCFALTAMLPASAQAQEATHDKPPKPSPEAHRHDGFFLNLEGGYGFLFLDSTSSISNGFQQEIPSSAADTVFPAAALELGGTLSGTGLALGGRIFTARCESPVMETLGERFEAPLVLQALELSAIVEYYPDPTTGLHFGGGLGWLGLDPSDSYGGEMQRGPSASLEVGHGFWIGKQWSLGAALRLTAATLSGDEHGQTTLFLPGLYAALSYH